MGVSVFCLITKIRHDCLFKITSLKTKVNVWIPLSYIIYIWLWIYRLSNTQMLHEALFYTTLSIHASIVMKSIIDIVFFLFQMISPISTPYKTHAGEVKSSENQTPFNNEAYSAFKNGKYWRGILLPSLTNSFRARSLERSYLTYSHRQRQKSLLIVNLVDLVLKIVLAVAWASRKSNGNVCVVHSRCGNKL